MGRKLRPLRPATDVSCLGGKSQSGAEDDGITVRRSVACINCQNARRKCVGSPPCDRCISTGLRCIIDPMLDERKGRLGVCYKGGSGKPQPPPRPDSLSARWNS